MYVKACIFDNIAYIIQVLCADIIYSVYSRSIIQCDDEIDLGGKIMHERLLLTIQYHK